MRRTCLAAPLVFFALAWATGCSYGPPPSTGAPPPAQCQEIIDRCEPYASNGAVSAADDCVRIARDMTTTAEHCVEIQAQCAAACSAGDAGGAAGE